MSFSSLGLHSIIVNQVTTLGYQTPTPIQLEAIPAVLANRDVMAGAQTGTGKTAAFALPLLHRLFESGQDEIRSINNKVSVLVLTPTRELAQQVYRSFVEYGQGLPLRSVVAYGGASINTQIDEIK